MFRAKFAQYQLQLVEASYRADVDPESGQKFYVNTKTGEAQWTKPKALHEDEDIQILKESSTRSSLHLSIEVPDMTRDSATSAHRGSAWRAATEGPRQC